MIWNLSLYATKQNKQTDKIVYELNKIIGMSATYEALTIARGVHDTKGVEAWRRLNRRYSPHTGSHHVILHMYAVAASGSGHGPPYLTVITYGWVVKMRNNAASMLSRP